jgi:hypothetical protein
MQLPTEIVSLIFKFQEKYKYIARQNNVISTVRLHDAINDKYRNIKLNKERSVIPGNVPWMIYINFNYNMKKFYKLEIYSHFSLFYQKQLDNGQYTILQQYQCFSKYANMPFEKWEKGISWH